MSAPTIFPRELDPQTCEQLAIAVLNLRDCDGKLIRMPLHAALTDSVLNASPVLRQLSEAEQLRSLPSGFKVSA